MAGNIEVAESTDNYLEKLVSLNRVAKVVKGGRQFGFTALTVVGDGAGRVGVGYGKAKEVPTAIQKAMQGARNKMNTIPLANGTLHYPIIKSYGAVRIIILPAAEGTGIIAGGMMRAVFEVLGVRNVVAKCLGSRNPINVVTATVKSLTEVQSPAMVAKKRGKKLSDIRKSMVLPAGADAPMADEETPEPTVTKTSAAAKEMAKETSEKTAVKATAKAKSDIEDKPSATAEPKVKPKAKAKAKAGATAKKTAAKAPENKDGKKDDKKDAQDADKDK